MGFKLPATTAPFVWGAVAGAVLSVWVGFDGFGWKTRAAAETLATRSADSAVVSALASICRDRFSQAAGFPARLATLEKVEKYSRGEEIVKGGWATMVGSKEAQQGVGDECANLLLPKS
jgi:hypothetical protein